MVSLITRSQYIQQIEADEYSMALASFLFGSKLSEDSKTSSNANDISRKIFYALQANDHFLFSKLYEEISRRKPNKESEWIFNDILLFAIILGVFKFKSNKEWIKNVLKIRFENSKEDSRIITQTFIDVLEENLINKNNHQALMLVMKHFLDLPINDENILNTIYEELIHKEFPYSKASFVNLICIKATDIIFLSKGLIDLQRQKAIDEFIEKFNKRISLFSALLWGFLFAAILLISVYCAFFYINATPEQAEELTRVLTILPFVGFSGLNIPIFIYRAKIISFFKGIFFRFYNYKEEKISKNN